MINLSYGVQTWNDETIARILEALPSHIKIVATQDKIPLLIEWARAGWLKGIILRSDSGDRAINLANDLVEQAIVCADDNRTFAQPFIDAGLQKLLWLEGPNEKPVWNIVEMQAFSLYETVRAEVLATYNLRALCYQFPIGHPEIGLWSYAIPYLRRIKAAGGGIALHQYSQPRLDSAGEWTTWRHQEIWKLLPPDLQDIPLFITEFGIDGGANYAGAPTPQPKRGWQTYCSEEEYLRQVKLVAPKLQQARAVFFFTLGDTAEAIWATFEMQHASLISRWIGEQNKQEDTMPETYDRSQLWDDYMALYAPLPALLKLRAEHPELGDAIERGRRGKPIEHDYGKYRVSFYAGGIAWVEINNWTNRGVALALTDLPLD